MSLILASLDDFSLPLLSLLRCFPSANFPFVVHSTLLNWISLRRGFPFSLIYLFISVIYLYQYSPKDISFYSLYYDLLVSFCCYSSRHAFGLAVEKAFSWLLCSLGIPPLCFKHSDFLAAKDLPRSSCISPGPTLYQSHF